MAAPKKKGGVRAGTRKIDKGRLAVSGLTVEQEAYARARALGMSIEEAVKAAGCKITPATARRWEMPNGDRTNQKLIDRINELAAIAQQNAIIKTGLDREWVISRYMEVVNRCMQAEPVLDRKGQETGQYTFNAAGANQALRALGDTLGMFKPADKQPGDEYESLSDDDLARLAHQLAEETGLLAHLAGDQETAGRGQAIEVQAVPPTA
ncbi:MAG: hypothetical protein WC997_02380 [Porticoccaceae bacterium]